MIPQPVSDEELFAADRQLRAMALHDFLGETDHEEMDSETLENSNESSDNEV